MDVRTDRPLEGTVMSNPKSTMSIAGHPLHAMIIPFPIVCFVLTLCTDIIFFAFGGASWVLASEWLLAAGLIMAGIAAILGITDFLGERRIRSLNASWWHMGGNVVAVLISLYNFIMRDVDGAASGLPWTGLLMSAIVVCILLFTGWKGWEMVYRHRVGVAD